MKKLTIRLGLAVLVCLAVETQAHARGFGGFRGGFSSFGGYRGFGGGGYSFDRGGFGGYGGRDFSYGGSRSGSYSDFGGYRGYSGSYDRSISGNYGGSLSVSGTRGAAVGPWGGVAAGGTRTISGTTPGGRSFDETTSRGGIMGPGGRYVGGGSRYGVGSGPGGTIGGGARWGATGVRFPTDTGLAHYTAVGGYGALGHSTAFWSNSYLGTRAGYVRGGFFAYNSFNPNWYAVHPGAWAAAGWAANYAWTAATWPSVATFLDISAPPVYMDYGNTIVYQNNNVYVNGTDEGTAEKYNQQAISLATAGQEANPPKTDKWEPLGVFALAQGDEKTSNTMFQLAVNKQGIIRGNYFDALMGTSTEVYGSVDPKTQRAAWTIGKNKNTVFETGINNLTRDETPVLVHFGKDKTQQWLLVRVEKPKAEGE
jgi:hypothetical protein